MIKSKNDTSKNLEKALRALTRAKQRVANEKKKQNEKKRKAEKPLLHNPRSPMPRMKARAIQNDEGKFHLQWTMPASWHMRRALSVLRQPKGEKVSKLPYAIPLRKLRLLPLNEAMLHFVNICVQIKAKEQPLSAHKVYECACPIGRM